MSEKPKPKLHVKNVLKLPTVGGKRTDYYDREVAGLSLRVSPTGPRIYSVRYRPAGRLQPVRYTIGDATKITLAEARDEARKVLAKAELGGDPQASKVEARKAAEGALTLADLCKGFLAFGRSIRKQHEGREWRPKTRQEFERIAGKLSEKWGSRRADKLPRQEVLAWAEEIAASGAGVMANRYVEVLRLVYSWGVAQGKLAAHPFPSVPKIRAERPDARTFTEAETRRIFAAVGGTELAGLVPVLFYTGARSHEARAMQWSDLDLRAGLWVVRPETAKDGESRTDQRRIPLSEAALRVLRGMKERKVAALSPYVFPASTGACDTCGERGHMDKPNKSLALVRDRSKVDTFHLHRIRRTVAQWMEDQGTAGDVIEHAVLGHARPWLRRTYAPVAGLKLHREALDAWGEHLDAILGAKEDEAEAHA